MFGRVIAIAVILFRWMTTRRCPFRTSVESSSPESLATRKKQRERWRQRVLFWVPIIGLVVTSVSALADVGLIGR
ncbi:hypothetical protein AB0J83_24570 [Actinoplanes sp. NPDC049596]|uniref:hypothetical protein n=1 Tax=unclassified Actinoplanes TaxID=2626549 RepID=UPI00341B4840